MNIKNKVTDLFAVLLAEFLGTGTLVFIFLRMQYSRLPAVYFIAVAVALTLAAVMFAFGKKSGGHFNPAITIALWTARKVKTLTAVLYIVVQMFGAWAAYQLFEFFYVHLASQSIPATYANMQSWDLHIFLAEAFGALVFALGFAAAYRYARDHHTSHSAYVGLAFAIGVLVASIASVSAVSAGLINPAVAEGMRVFHIWSGAAWGTYVLGPVVGAIVGINLYEYFFANDKVGVSSNASVAAASSSSRSTAAKKPAAKRAAAKKPAKKTAAKKR